jgi:hypothetical protein
MAASGQVGEGLCTGRGHFVQLLEGPEDCVVTTYASILCDKRHRDVALVSAALVGERVPDMVHGAH